jgi:hypothetical protein
MTDEGMNIEQLMLEKITGVIDIKDEQLLNELLQKDEVYRSRYNTLREIYEKGQMGRFGDKARTNHVWINLSRQIEQSQLFRKRRRRMMLIAAIAVPVVLLMAGYFFDIRKPADKRLVDNTIHLQLGNGSSIVLSGKIDSTKRNLSSQVQLNMTQNGLSYIVKHKDKASAQLNTLVVPLTKTYQVVLSDGTKVWLNAASELKFPFSFSDSTREVYLNGEAYFKVAKDTRHPFIVHTALTEIQDLGTEFNVNAYKTASITTSLIEGQVVTSTKEGYVKKLVPGQQAVFYRGEGFKVGGFDQDSLISWRSGIYYFNHVPLEQIRPVIYRWFGKELLFTDPSLATYRFSGALFKNKSIKEFLDNLSITSGIAYQMKGEKIYLDSTKPLTSN